MGTNGNGPRQDQQTHPAQGEDSQSDTHSEDARCAAPDDTPGRRRRWPRKQQPSQRHEMEPTLIADLTKAWGATL
eukprot:8882947-Lingulodinium_polyedra.AAC.1